MSGKFYLSLMAIFVVSACGDQSQRYEERAKVERITALIDAKSYDSIINWYEDAAHSEQVDYERYYALAKLGKGGFDPIDIIPKILAPQTFRSNQRARLFGDCDNRQLESFEAPEIRCLVVRLMNQLPNVNHVSLLEGEAILAQMAAQKKLSSADYTLLLLVETSIIVKRVGNILEAYLELGDNINDQQLQFFYGEIEKAAKASEQWIETMERSPKEVSKRITGLSKISIMEDFGGKTKFIKDTGIPFVLDNIKGENRDPVAVLSRMFFIQVIDTVLRDYFKIDGGYTESETITPPPAPPQPPGR